MESSEQKNSRDFLLFRNAQGNEIRGNLRRLSTLGVSFEVYSNLDAPAVSEALKDCRIFIDGALAYAGRVVIGSVVDIGAALVCEARLAEPLRNENVYANAMFSGDAPRAFERFLHSSQSSFKIPPAFKLVVADIQTFLMEFQSWVDHFTAFHTHHLDSEERLRIEREVVHQLQVSFQNFFGTMFQKFEETSSQAEDELKPALMLYVQQHLHPLVLCAPFMRRTFEKPLGYAGDYEMVNMMVRDPVEGDTLFAKTLNMFFLSTPPVVAHRNRVARLKTVLFQEACRVRREDRPLRVLNVGCGPAKELQDFIADEAISEGAEFTLIDFNDETLQWTGTILEGLNARHARSCSIRLARKTVAQLIKEESRNSGVIAGGSYDLVYCAGLFDYLTNAVCAKLVELFYQKTAKGGLVLVTNVESANPSRRWMEFAVDWHLVYRDRKGLQALAPREADSDYTSIVAELTGVNVFLEIRKPGYD